MVLNSVILPTDIAVKQSVCQTLQKHFQFDIKNRITIKSDLSQFNWKEDESVWRQARGKAVEYYELYWDSVWICDFVQGEPKESVEFKFLTGFSNCYKTGLVTLNDPNIKTELDQFLEAESKRDKGLEAIEALPETNEQEHIVKEVLKGVRTDRQKGRKKNTKSSSLSNITNATA
jgi:hypothetical protein